MTIKIDDMRLGDFLYLLDCMQEECCCYKTCNGCRYNEICECDISNIETIAMKETVKSYAESNGLLEHMNDVNDQKWIPVTNTKRFPKPNQDVLVTEDGEVKICTYELWYGYGYGFYGSRGKVTAWMPLPEPYRGEEV